jgi:hypothetical protein
MPYQLNGIHTFIYINLMFEIINISLLIFNSHAQCSLFTENYTKRQNTNQNRLL